MGRERKRVVYFSAKAGLLIAGIGFGKRRFRRLEAMLGSGCGSEAQRERSSAEISIVPEASCLSGCSNMYQARWVCLEQLGGKWGRQPGKEQREEPEWQGNMTMPVSGDLFMTSQRKNVAGC
jgi:hypothetical protein